MMNKALQKAYQWTSDVFHCSENWKQKMDDHSMFMLLTETRKQIFSDEYSPDPKLYKTLAAYWNSLVEFYQNEQNQNEKETEGTTMKSSKQKYYEGKEKARQKAIEYQNSYSEGKVWYYSEIAAITEQFQKLAKRYGLTEEFRENGII